MGVRSLLAHGQTLKAAAGHPRSAIDQYHHLLLLNYVENPENGNHHYKHHHNHKAFAGLAFSGLLGLFTVKKGTFGFFSQCHALRLRRSANENKA